MTGARQAEAGFVASDLIARIRFGLLDPLGEVFEVGQDGPAINV